METLDTWTFTETCLHCNHSTLQVVVEDKVQKLSCSNCGRPAQDKCRWIKDRVLEDHPVEYINSILKQK